MSKELQQREASVSSALQLDNVNQQIMGMLGDDKRKLEAFRTKMIKMSLDSGLSKCSPESIINCGIQALTLDLPLEAGQGYIVKYGGAAQLDIGYKGWQLLAKRSGYSVLADVVYSCDVFQPAGFGFNADIHFQPNIGERKHSNDDWTKKNLTGVIVSMREDSNGLLTTMFVEADLIHKIVGGSPSAKSDFSPHNKWTHQMYAAKAIKYVLSKAPIDISKAAMFNDALQIVNSTELSAQQQAAAPVKYSEADFTKNWPAWVSLVESGQKSADSMIAQLCGALNLTKKQVETVLTLRKHEAIDGDIVDGELTDNDTQDVSDTKTPEAEVA